MTKARHPSNLSKTRLRVKESGTARNAAVRTNAQVELLSGRTRLEMGTKKNI